MYTVDASVWVNAFDKREPGNETSRRFLETVQAQALPVVIPNLLSIEVAGAISRTRGEPARALEFVTALASLPNVTLLPLDEGIALKARYLAAQNGLRGADAVYAAVALHADCTLVSLDREHLTRLAAVVSACSPESALAEIENQLADEAPPMEAEEDTQVEGASEEETVPTTEPEPPAIEDQ